MPLPVGTPAPEFELMTENPDVKVKLADFRGKKRVVLLFYPMDFSSVCTGELCAMGPALDVDANDDETVVFGVSCDSPFAHAAFKKQYGLPFTLLSDVTRKTVKDYDLFFGEHPFNCGRRATVIVGRDGNIEAFHDQAVTQERTADDLKRALAG